MPKMNLSHFEAAMLFAFFTSIVLGIITKRTDRLAQEAREIITVINKIATRLRESDKQWWVFFDSIDSPLALKHGGVNELIHALIELANDGQMPLRIVLAGRAADEFAQEHTDGWVEHDTAQGLSRGDVDAWLRVRADEERRQIDEAQLDGELSELFPPGPLPDPRRLALTLPSLLVKVLQP